MLYLALGAALLGFFLWIGRGKPLFGQRAWRVVSGVGAMAAFAAGAFLAARGGWAFAPVLLLGGLWLAMQARRSGTEAPARSAGAMSLAEARALLGVEEGASPEEIRAAYNRLIRRTHPDAGGTAGLAAQLNAARDRLLRS